MARSLGVGLHRASSRAILVASVLMALPALAQSVVNGGGPKDRPRNIPADFVETPSGYVHPTCIHEAAPGEVVLENGWVQRPDGRIRTVPPCAHPRYGRQGHEIRPNTSYPPTVNGWAGSVWGYSDMPPAQRLSAEWTVPNAPSTSYSHTVYLFPGLVTPGSTRILQPVLAWNGLEGGGKKWVIYSWNCCVNDGNTWRSQPVDVPAGARVRGLVEGSNCDATNVCRNWRITTEYEVGPQQWLGTTLDAAITETMPWIYSGALELYNLTTCSAMPSNPSTTFSNVAVQLVGGAAYTGGWTNQEDAVSPDCVTGVSNTATTATISYTRTTPCTPLTREERNLSTRMRQWSREITARPRVPLRPAAAC